MIYKYLLTGIGLVVVAAIWWRNTSVARGARGRDERLFPALDLIARKLSKNETVTAEEVAELSRQPQYRPMLYQMLKHLERLDLFPADALSLEAQGAGILSYWMMHPNELQEAPSEIEVVEEIEDVARGKRGKFLVCRYRMPAGHWAETEGWLLGLAGPFFDNDVPYSSATVGFSRCSAKYGELKPRELVEWYLGVRSEQHSSRLSSIVD